MGGVAARSVWAMGLLLIAAPGAAVLSPLFGIGGIAVECLSVLSVGVFA